MIDPVSAFRSFVQRRTGVVIPEDRAYLIASRLGHLVKANDMTSLDRLIERIVSSENAELVNASLDAMMTGETLFFRDRSLFCSFSETLLPAIIASR